MASPSDANYQRVIVIASCFTCELRAVIEALNYLNFLYSRTGIENADKLSKEVKNLNNDNLVNVTLLDENTVTNFKLRKKIPVKHQICNINGGRLVTKTIAKLRIGDHRGMTFDREDRRSYRNCDNCLDTDLTPANIFDCPAILAAL
ncbi:uncharacterized protein TNCV_4651891 [Trichonephila clavipes]|nr:uncharacterized protein TNCV_4651891 [Trichonephila clavipes]